MWLDGIYMGAPFYAQFAKTFNRPAGFDDVANQIIWIESHTRDSKTGLLYHAWDERKEQEWADPKTGCSKNFWGRAIGWYVMGIADVLDFMPQSHPDRAKLLAIFQRTLRAIAKYQDEETGLWYQVVDQGKRPGNYLEASASSMYVYAIAKGIRQNYLERKLLPVAQKGFKGLTGKLIKVDANGSVHLTRICSVAGLGGSSRRDGTYEYYISEPVVSDDLKGVGAFILASVEMEQLAGASKE
jgi:unsaturated rhamnogalacturonyl hydrolase